MSLLMKVLLYLLSTSLLLGGGYIYGQTKYKQGEDSANVVCQANTISMQKAITKSNADATRKANQQKKQYKDAIKEKDIQIEIINGSLSRKTKEIRKKQHESKDACVNATIPVGFR
jgi:uncharacterized membrane protein